MINKVLKKAGYSKAGVTTEGKRKTIALRAMVGEK
jgi:hypothetical protein